MGWFVAVLAASLGWFLWWSAARRMRRGVPVREAAAGRRVAELGEGRFRVVGKVIALGSDSSLLDGAPCVYAERASYRTVVSEFVPLLREVEREVTAHPFLVDDGTGRVCIDPDHAIMQVPTVRGDQGLSAERRLLAGAEVEVVANFAPRASVSPDDGPYRPRMAAWEAVDVGEGPPIVGPRVVPISQASEEGVALRRGLGLMMIVASAAVAVASSL